MNAKARVGWRQEKKDNRLGRNTKEEVASLAERPFVVRLPTERGDRGTQAAWDPDLLSGVQVMHFRSQEELMEFVLRALTEDEIALTQRVIGER